MCKVINSFIILVKSTWLQFFKNTILHSIFCHLEINKFPVIVFFITSLLRNFALCYLSKYLCKSLHLVNIIVLNHLQYLQGTLSHGKTLMLSKYTEAWNTESLNYGCKYAFSRSIVQKAAWIESFLSHLFAIKKWILLLF